MKLHISLLLTTILFIFTIYHPVEASSLEPLDKHGIKELLQKADEAQYSLSLKHYSWEEALTKLSSSMKEDFAIKFMEEHLFLEEEGYIFYGTDFSIYFIPHFSFDEKTNIVLNSEQNAIYIFEKFTGSGPVEFEEQYELVTLVLDDTTWKISNISFLEELPEEVKLGTSIENNSSLEITSMDNVDMEIEQIVEPLTSLNTANTFNLNLYYGLVGVVPYFSIFQHSNITLQLAENEQQKRDTFFTLSNIVWKK
jgi:hypothetical protein